MKKVCSAFVLLLILHLCPQGIQAQRAVTITGDTCIGSVLKAHITGVPQLLKWYKSDTTVALARSTWLRESVIVAGGHGAGSAANQLSTPQAIFIDNSFDLYIVDNLRIQRWSRNADSGVTVAGGNGKGSNTNQFYATSGLWVDEDKNVFASDFLTDRVVKWAPGATNGIIVAGGNGYGSNANQFAGAGQICMDKQKNLYIADRFNQRVQKWAPGATSGTTVAGGNGRGSAANQLKDFYSIAIDTAGNLYIADSYNNRIQKWAPGATEGVTVAGGKGPGLDADQLSIPSAVHVDSAGNLYIVDNANYRIQKWTPGANFGITVAGGYGFGRANFKLSSSYGVTTDKLGNVYASEIGGNKVKKFMTGRYIDTVFSPAEAGYYKASVTYKDGGTVQSNVYRVVTKPEQPDGIEGPQTVNPGQNGVVFKVRHSLPDAYYSWETPAGADIVDGQGTETITVNFGSSGGRISVFASNICGTSARSAKKSVQINSAGLLSKIAASKDEAAIYPNPAGKDVWIVCMAEKSEVYNITLTDVSGKILLKQSGISQAGENRIHMDVSQLTKGTYLVTIISKQKSKQIFKLNKQ